MYENFLDHRRRSLRRPRVRPTRIGPGRLSTFRRRRSKPHTHPSLVAQSPPQRVLPHRVQSAWHHFRRWTCRTEPAADSAGSQQLQAEEIDMICANCHKSNADSARFCGSCGRQLQGAGAGAQPAVAAAYPGAGNFAVASAGRPGAPERRSAGGGGGAGGAGGASAATSAPPGLLERIKNILLNPKQEWLRIDSEPTTIGQLYSGYVVPIAAFAALISFVHLSLIGVSLPFGGAVRTPIVSGLIYALVTFGFALLGLFAVGLIINGLAPTFSGTRDQRQALKTAAYALTPAWLSTVLSLLPLLTLLQLLAGLYGIYLLYLGLPPLMRAPREKAFGYTATVVICTILLGILFGVLSAATGAFSHLAGGGRGLLGSGQPGRNAGSGRHRRRQPHRRSAGHRCPGKGCIG